MSPFRHDLTHLKDAKQLEAAKHRVTETLQEIGVLDGLSKAHRRRLAERVFRITKLYQFRDQILELHEELAELKRRPPQLRRLATRVRKFTAAFAALAEEVERVQLRDDGDILWRIQADEPQFMGVFEEIAGLIDGLRVPTDARPERTRRVRVEITGADRLANVSVALFKFFTTRCGLPKGPATARIARIENTMWRGNIRVYDRSSRTPNRSSAICKRISRQAAKRR